MAYADLLNKEGIKSQFLCVIEPRRFVNSGWSNVSGTRYTIAFTYGEPTIFKVDNAEATKASDTNLSDGDWYFESSVLYFDDGASDPNLDISICISYEIYVGTFDAHFNRDPLDANTKVVYYDPLITQSPTIKQSVSDGLFGIFPSLSSSISLSSVTQDLLVHLYDSSFNLAPLKLYHWLDELKTENVKLITKGLCSNVNYTRDLITIQVFDSNKIYDLDFRHASGESFYDSRFNFLDPEFFARPVRKVYGVVDGFVPVNIGWATGSAVSTSNNRNWVCARTDTNLGNVETTVLSSPTSTTTRTYLTSADGFRVGDSVWIDSNAGSGFDEYPIVTLVNKTGSHYIEHDAITNVASNPDLVKRSCIGNVTIVKDGVTYQPLFNRDYQEYTNSTYYGFNFRTSMEANLGIPSVLLPKDLVYCRVYGNKNSNTIGGGSFGSDSADTGNLTNPAVIIYELIKSVGISEDEINTASFQALESSLTGQVGFAIPHKTGQDFPSIKNLINEILGSELLRLSFDDENKYKLSQASPIGTIDKTIEEDLILQDSFNYQFSYADVISNAIVEYNAREVSPQNIKGELVYLSVNSISQTAIELHSIEKQKTFKSLHFIEADAQSLADRLKYALGDRMGTLSFSSKNEFFNTELNDFFTISTDRMPGFSYERGTLRNINATVLGSDKSLNQITITLDDQKGIEDNSGSF